MVEGLQTGGWTKRYTSPQTTVASYDPEKATTWELGVKSTLLDRHLQINAAAFTTKYTGIQLNYQVGTSPTIDNVGTRGSRASKSKRLSSRSSR